MVCWRSDRLQGFGWGFRILAGEGRVRVGWGLCGMWFVGAEQDVRTPPPVFGSTM